MNSKISDLWLFDSLSKMMGNSFDHFLTQPLAESPPSSDDTTNNNDVTCLLLNWWSLDRLFRNWSEHSSHKIQWCRSWSWLVDHNIGTFQSDYMLLKSSSHQSIPHRFFRSLSILTQISLRGYFCCLLRPLSAEYRSVAWFALWKVLLSMKWSPILDSLNWKPVLRCL
jgi:hypothetical protein